MADSQETKCAIKNVLAGDREAFRFLVREHSLMLRSFLGSHLHHQHEMDDLAQEVFVKAFKNLDQYNTDCDFRVWLRGIARNELLTFFRTVGRRKSNEAKFREEATKAIQQDIDSAFDDQSDAAIEALLRCIGRLPEKLRHVVRSGLDGIKPEKLADELSTSVGAVYNLHYRANGMLRDCVQGEIK